MIKDIDHLVDDRICLVLAVPTQQEGLFHGCERVHHVLLVNVQHPIFYIECRKVYIQMRKQSGYKAYEPVENAGSLLEGTMKVDVSIHKLRTSVHTEQAEAEL